MKGPAKTDYLASFADLTTVPWIPLSPNSKNDWFTDDLKADFDEFVPLGSKEAKASFSADSKTIFKSYSLGVSTNRDDWVYNFDRHMLWGGLNHFANAFNQEVTRWRAEGDKFLDLDSFVAASEYSIKWSRNIKRDLKMGKTVTLDVENIREALYRPFCKKHLYFADTLIDERGAWPRFSPKPDTKNRVIVVSDVGCRAAFSVLMTDAIPDLHLCASVDGFQCFPLYTYSADGSERFDNLTSYALETARAAYGESVSREDIFYATYALLHHPAYRARYSENLKRELPRLPLDLFAGKRGFTSDIKPDWNSDLLVWPLLVRIGRELGDLHVGYESAPIHPFPLRDTTPDGLKFSFRVERMRWLEDKSKLRVNASIELSGFTPAMFQYRPGNRPALDWVAESYRVKRDARSGLTSDPNRDAEPNFILDLIGRVATVSLETQRLVGELPPLFGA